MSRCGASARLDCRFQGWRQPDGLAAFQDGVSGNFYVYRDDRGKPERVGRHRVPVPLTLKQQQQVTFWLKDTGGRPDWWHRMPDRERLRRGLQAATWPKGEPSPVADAALADALARPGKVVLYTESVGLGVPYLSAALDAARVGYRNIEGKFTPDQRADALRDFQHDPRVRILIASRVLEYGLDLQFCRVLISIDTSWNPSREEQREGRVCRLGSPHATYEHTVYVPDAEIFRSKSGVLDRKTRLREDAFTVRAPKRRAS